MKTTKQSMESMIFLSGLSYDNPFLDPKRWAGATPPFLRWPQQSGPSLDDVCFCHRQRRMGIFIEQQGFFNRSSYSIAMDNHHF